MNEFKRFILNQMGQRGWRAADLAKESGLSKQHVSKLLNDERDVMDQMPAQATIDGLARAFTGVPITAIRAKAVQGLGVPAADLPPMVLDLQEVSVDALLEEIKRRIGKATRDEDAGATSSSTQGRSSGGLRVVRDGPPPMKGDDSDTGSPVESTLSAQDDLLPEDEPLGAVAYMGEEATDADRAFVTELARQARETHDAKQRDPDGLA